MNIYINEEKHSLQPATNVQTVVSEVLQLQMGGIAVAINDCVVPRSTWETTWLNENDKVLIIKACSGG